MKIHSEIRLLKRLIISTFVLIQCLSPSYLAKAQAQSANDVEQQSNSIQNAGILRVMTSIDSLTRAITTNYELNDVAMRARLSNDLLFQQQLLGGLSNMSQSLLTNTDLGLRQSTLAELSNTLASVSALSKPAGDAGLAAYREADLRIKDWQVALSTVSLLSFIVAAWALTMSYKGLRRAEREWITKMLFDCDKALVDNPQLWFIYDDSDCTRDHGLTKSTDSKDRAREDAFLYQHFNMFGGFEFLYGLEPKKKCFESDKDHEYRKTWRRYVSQLFRGSSRARDLWKRTQTEDVYTTNFREVMNGVLEEAEAKNTDESRQRELVLMQFRVFEEARKHFSIDSPTGQYWAENLKQVLKDNKGARDLMLKAATKDGFSKTVLAEVTEMIREIAVSEAAKRVAIPPLSGDGQEPPKSERGPSAGQPSP